jgi:hypothetical protein
MVNTTPALSGYYVIEAPDLDAATEIARQVPSKFGGVEVRVSWPARADITGSGRPVTPERSPA